jgi:molybdenum cofactor biosynthesis enzyme MoaA
MEGALERRADRVALARTCPEHGPSEITLSRHPEEYADLDRFYFKVLKKGAVSGRVTNYWLLSTSRCQMLCDYCQVDVKNPVYDEMSREDLDSLITGNHGVKLTLSGGEPTLHPDIEHFFRNAARTGARAQLATNGLALADRYFCLRLKAAGCREVRLSLESFTPFPEGSPLAFYNRFIPAKLAALKNLGELGFAVSLSPTIFKGLNEHMLAETVRWAACRPFVREISVNGFSWTGAGAARSRDEMMPPDLMMDALCAGLSVADRGAVFTLQKALFTLLHLLGIRICMYTQFMVFTRRAGAVKPVTARFDRRRMERGLAFWERFSGSPWPVRSAVFLGSMLYAAKPAALGLTAAFLRMVLANHLRMDFTRYPSELLPVVLNTNCSPLSADEELGRQCMSAFIYRKNGRFGRNFSTRVLSGFELRP